MMAKMGRPRKQIDKTEFEKLCFLQCTEREFCSWFDVSDETLNKWCKENYDGRTFLDVFKEKRENGIISLRRTQFQLAEKSPAMAIFLGKNLLGQTDKMEQTVNGGEALTNINVRFIKDKSEAAGNEPKSD
jgi:hypothetical protein